jgi:hypothetical protein
MELIDPEILPVDVTTATTVVVQLCESVIVQV